MLTNCVWLNLDTIFEMRIGWILDLFSRKHSLATKGVDECSAA